jgi:hypothetical protein
MARISTHNKTMVIVEETVQRVYLLDPDDQKTAHTVEALRGLVSGQYLEGIPMSWDKPITLGKRAKKAPLMPNITLRELNEVERFSTFAKLTVVVPDETGNPSLEFNFTKTTASRKPVKA